MLRIYNVHLDAISYVRHRLAVDYPTALRVAQLYGFLEHLSSRGGAATFNQRAYSQKTGCHRDVLRKDLKTLEANGWARVISSPRGTVVQLQGIPFDQEPEIEMPTAWPTPGPQHGQQVPTVCATVAHDVGNYKKETKTKTKKQTTTQQTKKADAFSESDEVVEDQEPKKAEVWRERPRPWNKKQKAQVVKIWNDHRPPALMPLADDGIDHDRADTLARLMNGRGGFKKFVEYLPEVLDSLKENDFWGDSTKSLSFDSFFGTSRNRKAHWAQQLDRIKSSCQASKPDKAPLAWDEFNGWIQIDQTLKGSQIIDAAVAMVDAGAVPKKALSDLSIPSDD